MPSNPNSCACGKIQLSDVPVDAGQLECPLCGMTLVASPLASRDVEFKLFETDNDEPVQTGDVVAHLPPSADLLVIGVFARFTDDPPRPSYARVNGERIDNVRISHWITGRLFICEIVVPVPALNLMGLRLELMDRC